MKKLPNLDARPDTLDFRDKIYEPTLVEVPAQVDLAAYKAVKVPILNQGQEGACTGFGLATVMNYLLLRRKLPADLTPVSARMIYEMAKRYDEWPGEDYEGSSARGAMKGWHKHGVCSEALWPYQMDCEDKHLTQERLADAVRRPLGAYYRVNHKDLIAMHSALAEVGILYATATVHEGWQPEQIGDDGVIPLKSQILGGHAFAIVAYDERGFWIQNSWGQEWGKQGFALITYDDWLRNGTDVWVARLGAPVILKTAEAVAISQSGAANKSDAYTFFDLRPHIISIGNNGRLKTGGNYGTSAADVNTLLTQYFPSITKSWSKKRLLLYAHGGLTSEESAIQRVADYRGALLKAEVYPISFIWRTDAWTTVENILQDALSSRRPEGIIDNTKDFMLDRLDDTLEPLTRLTGKAFWDEMKENAILATKSAEGGARIAAGHIAKLLKDDPSIELHLVGYSAGSIFHAPLVQLLTTSGKIASGPMQGETGYGLKITSCTLWVPACTTALFKQAYLPAIQGGKIGRFKMLTLTDQAEQDDDCAHIYNKSILYLVSNAFEQNMRIPGFRDGEPILGMAKFINADDTLKKLFKPNENWILSPNNEPTASSNYVSAQHHGEFDQNEPTLRSTLASILQVSNVKTAFSMHASSTALQSRRLQLHRR
ncbi:MAG TPA: C1 family peptidase [Allocoleopsis sp.]